MKSTNILAIVLHASSFATLCLFVNPGAVAQGSTPVPDDRPYAVVAAADVDPNLFPLYVLDNLYASLPPVGASAQQQQDWIASAQSEISYLRAVAHDAQVDPSLDILFRDCVEFTSAYQRFLVQTEQIHDATDQRSWVDLFITLVTAAKDASDAEDVAGKFGLKQQNVSTVGAVTAILSGVSDANARGQQRDAAENAAILAERQKLQTSWTTAKSDGQLITNRLARKYGWSSAETDLWSDSASRDSSTMPRNPFAIARSSFSARGDERPADLMTRALRSFHAAEMVPSGDAYNRYRSLFLYESAWLAVSAASAEAGARGYSAGPTPSSANAVHFSNTYLAASPSDVGGSGHLLLARALGTSGRYGDAILANNQAFHIAPANQQNMLTVLRYARLLSLVGDADLSAQWLAKADSLGLSSVAAERHDPDLANLAKARPGLFRQLTTVRLSDPAFAWGLLMDDAMLRNNSLFPVTHLKVHVVVHKAASVYSFAFQCAAVNPGEVCRANNVVSIPGDAYDYLDWNYTCDQDL